MRSAYTIAALLLLSPATAALAQSNEEALKIAAESGACKELAVLDATFTDDGRVRVTCVPPTGFVALPLLGGIGGAAGAGLSAMTLVAGAAGVGASTPSTN